MSTTVSMVALYLDRVRLAPLTRRARVPRTTTKVVQDMPDFVASAALFGVLIAAAVARASAVAAHGASGFVRFDRVEAAGSSPFLGSGPMHAAYWVLTPFGRALARFGVSANAVTWTSLALGAAAGAALACGHFGIAALLAALSATGDAVDGIVARESQTSGGGEILDAAVDRYGEFFFLGGLAIFYRESAVVLALVLFAMLGSFMVSYASAKAEALAVAAPRGWMRRPERAVYLTLGAALVPLVATWSHTYASGPMVAAVFLVGVAANASAAYRFERIGDLAGQRDRAPASEKRPLVRAPQAVRDASRPLGSAVR